MNKEEYPERIYCDAVTITSGRTNKINIDGRFYCKKQRRKSNDNIEYIRADLVPQQQGLPTINGNGQWQTDTALLEEEQTILAAINGELKYGKIVKDSWDKKLVLYVEYDDGCGGEGWSLNSIKAWLPIPECNNQKTQQL